MLRSSGGVRLGRVLATLAIAVGANLAQGEPYTPTSDAEVLETLPSSPLFSRDQMATIRQRLAAEPGNAKLAATAAFGYLQMGQSTGNPRFYGYARAALRPWWDDADAPSYVLMQRAKIKERDHDYAGAIADLETLAKQEPQNTQAWIEVSNLYRVTGDYQRAWQASQALDDFAGDPVKLVARVPLMAVSGQAEAAYDEITKLLPTMREELIPWATAKLADLARTLGRSEEAATHYQEAFRLSPEDLHLRRTYAEFLLDEDRASEALALLSDYTSDNGALLLAAIAAQRSNEGSADKLQSELENRFEEIRLRGGQPHGRFEALYLLHLKEDAEQALAVALANWQKQKETRDTRNVLEAALAAGQPAAAEPVLAFLAEHQWRDTSLDQLAKKLEAKQ